MLCFFFVFVGTHTAYMLQCNCLLLPHSVLAVACGCCPPVVFFGEARDGVGEEGRQRPLLTVTVFAAGDLRGWRDWRNRQPRWMWAAPHLSSPSSSSQSTADTSTARQRRDHHSDGCEPIGLRS
ncbi:hypothetical protein TcCL_Unassigned04077 [Trypanosoma cruzi]|nr:hypothetical protein TcCL_Unassigned04077 [Trypanosoma cruzi]